MASRVPLDGIRQHILGTKGPVKRISVSNFAASLCEIQSLYRKMKLPGIKTEAQTKALARGIDHHEKLDDFEKVTVPPAAESLGEPLRLLNTAARWNRLAETGSGREIPLYGTYKGIELYGIADGFEKDKHNKLMVIENKTTWGSLPPQQYKMRLAYHQTLMYHYMFTQMMSTDFDLMSFIRKEGDQVDIHEDLLAPYRSSQNGDICPNLLFGTELDLENDAFDEKEMESAEESSISKYVDSAQFQLYNTMRGINSKYGGLSFGLIYSHLEEALLNLQRTFKNESLSDTITLRYSNNTTSEAYEIDFDRETQSQLLEYCGQLWLGEREPSPFTSEDVLFCDGCEFNSICEFVARANTNGVQVLKSPWH